VNRFLAMVWLGSFLILGWGQSSEDYRSLPTDFFRGTVYEEPDYRLHLGGQFFDPLGEGYQDADEWQQVGQDIGLHVIQFQQPVSRQDLEVLRSQGLAVVAALRPFSLIVWGQKNAPPSQNPSVRWSGDFLPGFKLLPRYRSLQGWQKVVVLTYRARPAELLDFEKEFAALGGEGLESRDLDHRFQVWYGQLPGESLIGLAHLPKVYTVQLQGTPYLRGELSAQLVAGNVDVLNQAVVGYQAWLTSIGLSGAGLVMACVDGGVKETHPDLSGRFLPCAGPGCAGAASSGHGTHVAGIMGGTGVSGVTDPNGFLRAQGMAPGAQMIEQNYINLALDPGGLLALIRESYANSAQLSNNSWGLSSIPAGYDVGAMELDIGVRDADPNTAGNQSFHYVLAIDNGNGGVSSIGTPDEAKNIFHVGAHQAQLTNTNQVAEYNNLATVTAHGPALDGRHLPLIVAPGCQVESAEPDTIYRMRCGTSMAAPHVTGSVALFIQHYRNLFGATLNPSPALVKAAFLPVAVDLEGFLDADGVPMGHRFNSKQGWGRLSLPPVLDSQVPVVYLDNPVVLNNTGETWNRQFQVANSSEPVKLMLAWTDAPGHGLGGATPALNNDLDVSVVYNSQVFRGNVFNASGWSAPGGVADALNNTEGVLLGPTATGTFQVIVQATDLNSDGIPGVGSMIDQDFALVCYNCESVSDFSLKAEVDSQEVCAPGNAVYSFSLEAIGGFNNPVTLSVPNLPLGLMANFSQNPVTLPANPTLTLTGTGNLARGAYEINVLATSGAQQHQVVIDLFVEPGVPAAIGLVEPLAMATDVDLMPDFSWGAQPEALTYHFQLADNAGFTNPLVSMDLGELSYSYQALLLPETTYFWRVAGSNSCGMGTYATRSFQTRSVAPVLLVDDDNNTPDVRGAYTAALDAIGVSYEVFDTQNSAVEPDNFGLYQAVVWFSGSALDTLSPKAGPTEASQGLLAAFLDQGGSLFISSQSYFNDLSIINSQFNTFMRDYLGVANGVRDAIQETVTGEAPVFSGIGPVMVTPGFGNESDSLNPTMAGVLAFSGDQGNAGVILETTQFKTCWLGFALEGLPAPAMESTLRKWFVYLGFDLPCSELADLMEQLPQWTAAPGIAGLIQCVNAINAP